MGYRKLNKKQKTMSLSSYNIMKNKIILLLLIISNLTIQSCIDGEQYDNTPQGNFEQLWTTIDEHYCFFDYKNINWDSIHTVFSQKIETSMSNKDLFEVLSDMLYTLKDGHVNLISSYQCSYYDAWYQDYPHNFDEDIVNDDYLGKASTDYYTTSGIKYKIFDDNIGYMRYESFANDVGNGNLDEILEYLAICNGLIIDVRDNSGGTITNATKIAQRFTNEKLLIGYIEHKTGTGHNNFSSPTAINLKPSNSVRWQKKVVVLTNRRCFSATNYFVNTMRYLANVTILGDTTGGGSGLPFSSELPNGWTVRFSSSPILDADKNQIEFGIEPDIKIDLSTGDTMNHLDTMIETARKLLNK